MLDHGDLDSLGLQTCSAAPSLGLGLSSGNEFGSHRTESRRCLSRRTRDYKGRCTCCSPPGRWGRTPVCGSSRRALASQRAVQLAMQGYKAGFRLARREGESSPPAFSSSGSGCGKLGCLQFRSFIVIQRLVVGEQGNGRAQCLKSLAGGAQCPSPFPAKPRTSFTLTSGDGSLLLPIQHSARAEIIWQTWDP
jgi:hypothetical protein